MSGHGEGKRRRLWQYQGRDEVGGHGGSRRRKRRMAMRVAVVE